MSRDTSARRRTGAAGTIEAPLPAAEVTVLHVLVVDDSEDDALVIVRELKRGGYSPLFERVDTAETMISALKDSHWDVIICDYVMPSFSGLAALDAFKASGLDLPFILVSGKVGEDRAVEAMRAGATDYVMKDKLNRLVPAIKRELDEVKSRRDHRKAAQSLKQSEERYQALAEGYSDVIWVTDMNGGVTYLSPSVTRLLGYSVEELMAHSTDLTLASLKASINATAQALSAEQEGKAGNALGMTPLELELRHKNGSIAWASASFSPILDSDGRPIEMVAVLHDITERKRAEEILRDSERRLKILFESAPDAYYLNDMEGRFVDGNRAAEAITGYERKELIGKSLLELGLISAEQMPKAAVLLDHNQHGQPTGPDEFVLKRKDGSLVNVEVNTSPATINGQRLALGSVRNLTERRRAEEAIRESESRYRLLAENLSDVIWTMDTNLRYTYMSPSVTSLRGYSVEEAIALSMEETTTPASLQTVLRVMATAEAKEGMGSNSQSSSVTLELELNCKDGSTVWAENRITYLRDSAGRLTGYLGVSRDITERREVSQRLEQSLQKLERTLDGTIQAITRMVESKDSYTVGHQRRVAQLGCAIAQEMGFAPDQVQVVRIAGLLHDIGNISVPQELLNKPGKLTDTEFQLIKTHSQTGYDILKPMEFPWPIADIVVQHHERMDGSGYPSGIREDKLLMEARILGVADVVEAMNSYRPYRTPLGIDKALELISRNSGILYDPRVVDVCVRLFTEKGFEFED